MFRGASALQLLAECANGVHGASLEVGEPLFGRPTRKGFQMLSKDALAPQ